MLPCIRVWHGRRSCFRSRVLQHGTCQATIITWLVLATLCTTELIFFRNAASTAQSAGSSAHQRGHQTSCNQCPACSQLALNKLAPLQIGGAVSLTRIMNACKALQKTRAPHEAPPLKAICDQLQWFAGVQIRNVATLAGNIVTGSPISDLNPVWVAMGVTFVVESADGGTRDVAAGDFFQGYRCAC